MKETKNVFFYNNNETKKEFLLLLNRPIRFLVYVYFFCCCYIVWDHLWDFFVIKRVLLFVFFYSILFLVRLFSFFFWLCLNKSNLHSRDTKNILLREQLLYNYVKLIVFIGKPMFRLSRLISVFFFFK